MFVLKLSVLILIPAIVVMLIAIRNKIRGFFLCGISGVAFVMALAQSLLQRGQNTLFEDINHISIKNMWIYMIIITIILVIFFFFAKRKYRERLTNYICVYNTCISLFILFYLPFKPNQDNYHIILYIVSAILISALVNKWTDNVNSWEMVENSMEALAPVASVSVFYGFFIMFFLPNQLFFTNISDIDMSIGTYMGLSILCTMGLIALLYLCLISMPVKLSRFVTSIYFSIAVIEYLQSIVLNGKMSALAGDVQEWPFVDKRNNAIIVIVLFLVLIILFEFIAKRKVTDAVESYVSIYMSLMMLLTIVYLALTTRQPDRIGYLTYNNLNEVGSEDNVIVFVLDRFDAQIFQNIMYDDSDICEGFKDFTYYPDITAEYVDTEMAIPHLLSGIKWEYSGGADAQEEYRQYIRDNSHLLEDISNNGYNTDIYTIVYPQFVNDKMNIDNYIETTNTSVDVLKYISILYKSSQYTTMPIALKANYQYFTDDFNACIISDKYSYNNKDVYDKYVDLGDTVNTNLFKKTFKFYHLSGIHQPYSFINGEEGRNYTDNVYRCGEDSINFVLKYINDLKEKGVYDNSTIIVTADHGYIWTNEGWRKLADEFGATINSNPILLVKKKHAESKEMQVANVSVIQRDLVQTIAEECGLTEMYGGDYDLDTAKDRKNLERETVLVFPYEKYRIVGDSRNPDNWTQIDKKEN